MFNFGFELGYSNSSDQALSDDNLVTLTFDHVTADDPSPPPGKLFHKLLVFVCTYFDAV